MKCGRSVCTFSQLTPTQPSAHGNLNNVACIFLCTPLMDVIRDVQIKPNQKTLTPTLVSKGSYNKHLLPRWFLLVFFCLKKHELAGTVPKNTRVHYFFYQLSN